MIISVKTDWQGADNSLKSALVLLFLRNLVIFVSGKRVRNDT